MLTLSHQKSAIPYPLRPLKVRRNRIKFDQVLEYSCYRFRTRLFPQAGLLKYDLVDDHAMPRSIWIDVKVGVAVEMEKFYEGDHNRGFSQ